MPSRAVKMIDHSYLPGTRSLDLCSYGNKTNLAFCLDLCVYKVLQLYLSDLLSRGPYCLACVELKGYPGETEDHHRELVDFCKDFQFERMGCFAYSEEDGTPAAEMLEQASPSGYTKPGINM